MARLRLDEIRSPIGTIVLVCEDDALCALDFEDCSERMMALLESRYGAVRLERARNPEGFSSRVRDYFDGDLETLGEVAVAPGGTPFQRRVWSALRDIAPGTTRTYAALASAVGRPRAARAVGAANGRNPIALALPCHRVVGANGSLTGYAGGLARKRWLLSHEGV